MPSCPGLLLLFIFCKALDNSAIVKSSSNLFLLSSFNSCPIFSRYFSSSSLSIHNSWDWYNLHFNFHLVHTWCMNTAVELNFIWYMICLVLFGSKTQYIRTRDIRFMFHRVMNSTINVINWRSLSFWCDKVAISVIALSVWLLNNTGMRSIIGRWHFRYNKFVYLWLPWQLYHVFGSVTGMCVSGVVEICCI